MTTRKQKTVREPAVAGLFYPARPDLLCMEIENFLDRAVPEPLAGEVVALILPHAGYPYSGFTASIGYKLLSGRDFDTVVIVAPSHRERFSGISVYEGEAYKTPLGAVRIDQEFADALRDEERIFRSVAGHKDEHAIEVHLPFLQKLYSDVMIVPAVMGDQRRAACLHFGDRLAAVAASSGGKKRILLIASTDLSHYHPYEEARVLDEVAIRDIAGLEYGRLMDDLENGETEMCGGGPAVAVLRAASQLGATRAEVLYHCNSGDVTGEFASVVGYLSAAAFKAH